MNLLLQTTTGMSGITVAGHLYSFDSKGKCVVGDLQAITMLIKQFGCVPLTTTAQKGDDNMTSDIKLLDLRQKVNEGDEQLEKELAAFAEGYRLLLVKDGKAVVYR